MFELVIHNNKMVNLRINNEVYEEYRKLCKEMGWDFSKRIRYLILKDLNNLKKQIQNKKE